MAFEDGDLRAAVAERARADLGDKGVRGAGQRPVGRFENPVPRVPGE